MAPGEAAPAIALNAMLAFSGTSGISRLHTGLVSQLAGRVNLHVLVHARQLGRLKRAGLPSAMARAKLHAFVGPTELARNSLRIGAGVIRNPQYLDWSLEGLHAGISTRLFEGACVDRLGVDLFHGVTNYLPALATGPVRVVTIYDTIPLSNPNACRRGTVVAFLRQGELGESDEVVVISKSARSDFLSFFKHPDEQIHVIPVAINHDVFRPPPGDQEAQRQDMVLSIGHFEPRKNLVRGLAAFERVAANHPSLKWRILGPRAIGWGEFERALRESPVKDRVEVVHNAPDELLLESYQRARAFFYPSLSEGFGMPVLESFACGTPVAASAIPSVLEISNGLSTTFDPEDVPAMADALERAAFSADGASARRMGAMARSHDFGWPAVATSYLRVYAKALGREPHELLLPGASMPAAAS